MALPNFTVTGSLFDVPGDVLSGELVIWSLDAKILFTPNIKGTSMLLWDGDLYKIGPTTAKIISDGTVKMGPSNAAVKLLANDPGLNVDGIQWKADIYEGNESIVSFWFDAPADGGTVDLATLVPTPNAPAAGVSSLSELGLITLLNNSGSDVRGVLDTLYEGGGGGGGSVTWGTISGKPAVVAEGADQAAARATIGAGTSNLALGTTGSTAKAGNYQPAAIDISDSTTTGRAVIVASSQAAARTAIGALSSAEISTLITDAIDDIVAGAPGALDTLNELAAAIGDNADYASSVTTALAARLANVSEDTSPSLGGNLDLAGFNIGTAVPGDITILHNNASALNSLTSNLAAKADASALTSGLAAKADTSALTSGLATKADASALTSGLAGKVDLADAGNKRVVATLSTAATIGAAAKTDYTTMVDTSGAPTLPTAVGNTNRYSFKNISAGIITIATTSAQTIDGSATVPLSSGSAIDVISDGANWRIF